jgi:hypothetical protein
LPVTLAVLAEIREKFPRAASAQKLSPVRALMLAHRLNNAAKKYEMWRTLGAIPSNQARIRDFAPVLKLRDVLPFFDAIAAGGASLDVMESAAASISRKFIGPPVPRIKPSVQTRATMLVSLARQFIEEAIEVRREAKDNSDRISFDGAKSWLLTKKLPQIHLVIFRQPVGFSNNATDNNAGLFFIHLCARQIGLDMTPGAIAKLRGRDRTEAKRRDRAGKQVNS